MNIVEWMRLTIITNDKIFSCNISYYSYTVITIFPMNRRHPTHDRGSLKKNFFIFQKRNYASQQRNKSLNVTSVVTLIYWENTYLLINNNVLIIETYTKA